MTTSSGESERGAPSDAARLLVEAVHEWARERFGEAATTHLATGAAECTRCPICQLIAALRGDRPEVTEKLATVAATIFDALGTLLETSSGRSADGPESADTPPDPVTRRLTARATPQPGPNRPGGSAGRRAATPRVQRIDLNHVAMGDEDR